MINISQGLSAAQSFILWTLNARRTEITPPFVPEGAALDEVWTLAKRSRVAPVAAHALLDLLGKDHPQAALWSEVHDRSAKRMRIMLAELDAVAEALAAQNIRLIAMKNGGIARGIYPCAACCPMGDLDVLVSRSQFVQAHQIVQDCGFAFDSRSIVEPADLEQALDGGGGTEYVKQVDGEEVWFELQWRPIAGRWLRPEQEPAADPMLDRSVPIPGSAVRLFSPADNMIQVALHTAKHSYVRAPGLRLHTDVDRLTIFQAPDWKQVLVIARELHITTPVYFSLAFAHELFGTPVPIWVLQDLSPAPWKNKAVRQMLRRAGLFEPDEKKFSRPEMMVFHALLYDDARGLLASLVEEDRDALRFRNTGRYLVASGRRVLDLARRFQS